MRDRILGDALTFDDVLLVPRRSAVMPATADLRSRASRRVGLNVPILSAAMDTVTESGLAIALAQQGGLGIVHKNLSVDAQCREVHLVKRSVNGVIADPVTLPPDAPIAKARELMEGHRISGIPILEGTKVVGILTSRDLKFVEGRSTVAEVMTKHDLVTAPPETDLKAARTQPPLDWQGYPMRADDQHLARLQVGKTLDGADPLAPQLRDNLRVMDDRPQRPDGGPVTPSRLARQLDRPLHPETEPDVLRAFQTGGRGPS